MYVCMYVCMYVFMLRICGVLILYVFMYSYIDTEHPKLKYLYKYVKADIATNWYEIGVELFDAGDESVLDVISDNHSKDVNKCAGEMLKLWLARNPGATWNQLIIALKEPNIKLDTVAEKIKVMLTKGTSVIVR